MLKNYELQKILNLFFLITHKKMQNMLKYSLRVVLVSNKEKFVNKKFLLVVQKFFDENFINKWMQNDENSTLFPVLLALECYCC